MGFVITIKKMVKVWVLSVLFIGCVNYDDDFEKIKEFNNEVVGGIQLSKEVRLSLDSLSSLYPQLKDQFNDVNLYSVIMKDNCIWYITMRTWDDHGGILFCPTGIEGKWYKILKEYNKNFGSFET